MKRVCFFCCLASLLAFDSIAQTDSTALSHYSKSRAIHFARQLSDAKVFAISHNKPLFFKDDNGNPVYMVGVTSSGLPIYISTLNADAAVTTNVVSLRSGGALGLNLQGEGMRVGVWDGGKVKDHVEFGQRVIAKEGAVDDNHATHVTGTLIASGINPLAKGMAPLAEASTYDFLDDEAEMAALARANQSSMLFSNHSYGTVTGWFKKNGVWEWTGDAGINPIEDYRFGFYGERAQAIDQIAFLAPYYTIVWAAGNDRAEVGDGSRPPDCNGGAGYDCIIPEGVSKNSLTIGAANKVPGYSNPFDVTMSFFSSWGPTDDGRIKPDLVGAGVNLFSLSSTGTDTYATMSGTSMATPNITGSLLLVQELYARIHGGDYLKAATLKALAIHTAKEAGNFPGPDYSFGWGLLDVGAAANVLLGQGDQSVIIKESTLKNDSVFRYDVHPLANKKITATLVWTDPPAQPVTPSLDPVNRALVNDLDLRIIDAQGREQLPWTLDPANPSAKANHGDNFRDNVEKLEFELPEGKDYTLVVRHKAALLGGKQDFSLIVSYRPVQTVTTYYWVGDSGNWSDGSHWSMTSGGLPSLTVPGTADHAVIDENSFDGIGTDQISLTQDAGCAEVLWLNSKPSGISLNDHTLTISSKWIIADDDFSIATQGKIHFAAVGQGNYIVHNNNLDAATLIFDGSWSAKGNFSSDELRIGSGTLKLSNSILATNRLTVNGSGLHLKNTAITLTGSSSIDGKNSEVTAISSSLTLGSPNVSLLWQSIYFPGEIRIPGTTQLTIEGNNRIGKVYGQGKLTLNGSNRIDTLILDSGADLELAASVVQTLSSQTQFLGSAILPVTIQSVAGATLFFTEHAKLCFDFLKVNNVAVKGPAVVNAGIHSALSNAGSWRQGNCAEVLFADFDWQYNCVNASTEFIDKTSGIAASYTWQFGTGPVVHEINPAHQFKTAGTFKILLSVTGSNQMDSVSKSVAVGSNPIPQNHIISGNGTLTSVLSVSRYQWYKDGLALSGATSRTYDWHGQEGVYFVVSYDGQCNVLSDTLTVSGLRDAAEGVAIYPNPAVTDITIELPVSSCGDMVFSDLLGKGYLAKPLRQTVNHISIETIPDGVYVVQVTLPGINVRKKVVVMHEERR